MKFNKMSKFIYLFLITFILFMNYIPSTLSNPPEIKLVNSSYLAMTLIKDIGYQNFFSYEYINECFIDNNYNYNNANSCYINNNDIVEFTFKKELNNSDSFLSNNKSRQIEYLLSIDLSILVPLIKDATNMNHMFKGCKNLIYII